MVRATDAQLTFPTLWACPAGRDFFIRTNIQIISNYLKSADYLVVP